MILITWVKNYFSVKRLKRHIVIQNLVKFVILKIHQENTSFCERILKITFKKSFSPFRNKSLLNVDIENLSSLFESCKSKGTKKSGKKSPTLQQRLAEKGILLYIKGCSWLAGIIQHYQTVSDR